MASKKKNTNKFVKEIPSIKTLDDGTIEITYKIPYKQVSETKSKVVEELGKNIEVPGFRKGKAPASKVENHIPEHTLIEQTLGRILPKLVAETIKKEKIKPAIYPKFDLISAEEGKDWEIKAITCEIPEVKLGNYKKEISGTARAKAIWTPDKADKDGEKKEPSPQEKQQATIEALIETVDIKIPEILVRQEVDARLAKLLDRIQSLGLSLESYLASVGKNAEGLREEYSKQAKDSLTLELALLKIADEENIQVDKKEVDEAIEASAGDKELAKKLDTPEQRRQIEAVLRKRAALDKLTSYL
jgi:FKBP-type peptidyl-prolyl cis-trans isomerase (trigger factor)